MVDQWMEKLLALFIFGLFGLLLSVVAMLRKNPDFQERRTRRSMGRYLGVMAALCLACAVLNWLLGRRGTGMVLLVCGVISSVCTVITLRR